MKMAQREGVTTDDSCDLDMENLKHEFEDHLSVVVPCYNEAAVLEATISRLTTACQGSVSQYEIILVDDGSTDSTWGVLQSAATIDDHIVGVRLSKNHGHQLALLAGLAEVRGSVVLIIDADLQDPPELLPDMLALLHADEVDVVYGKRRNRAGESFLKTATAHAFYRMLTTATDVDIPLDTGDFRLMSRRMCDLLCAMPERDRFTRGMVAWLGFKQVPIEYDRSARFAGFTKYTPRKMLGLAADAFLGFSLLPLRMAIVLSGLTFLFSIGVIGYSVWSWEAHQTIPGWASIEVFSSIVASAQFAVLGVIGEYIGRIYLEGKNRPLYLVRNILDHRRSEARAYPTAR